MGRSSKEMTKYMTATSAYLRNLEASGLSQETVINYSRRLNLFYEFMLNNGYSESGPSFTAVLGWKTYLSETGVNPRSIREYLIELRAFFGWASDETMGEPYYTSNPVSPRLIPDTKKIEKRPYDILLTDEQIMLLLRNSPVKRKGDRNMWVRNYSIVMTLLFTKIRNAELLSLTPADLDFENETITIEHGKGNKFRTVEFHPLAQSAIKAYLQSHARPPGLSDDAPLFGTQADENGHISESGEWHKGTPQWLNALVKRHIKAVTGVSGIGTHDLRHIGARLDLNNGRTIEELQRELGHESIATTQIYCGKLRSRRANKNIKKIFEEAEFQARRTEYLLQSRNSELQPAF